MSLFGSILRDDFHPESDVDILVEFEEGKTPGLAVFGLEEEDGRPLLREALAAPFESLPQDALVHIRVVFHLCQILYTRR